MRYRSPLQKDRQCTYNVLDYHDSFSQKSPVANLTGSLPVGDVVIHADRRTDMTELIGSFLL